MDFTSTYNHHEITARVHTDGSVSYMTEAIQEKGKYYTSSKEFTSLDAIKAAIDKYELSLRKNFDNRTAYYLNQHWSGSDISIDQVTVTSIVDDTQAWIKTSKDERRKVNRDTLFTDRETCRAYLNAVTALDQTYRFDKEQLRSVLNKRKWEPQS